MGDDEAERRDKLLTLEDASLIRSMMALLPCSYGHKKSPAGAGQVTCPPVIYASLG